MAQRKRDKLDGIDADHIQRTLDSRGWQLIQQRITRALEAKLSELEKHSDAVATAAVRGEIGGLRLALRVPQILIDEGQENGKKS